MADINNVATQTATVNCSSRERRASFISRDATPSFYGRRRLGGAEWTLGGTRERREGELRQHEDLWSPFRGWKSGVDINKLSQSFPEPTAAASYEKELFRRTGHPDGSADVGAADPVASLTTPSINPYRTFGGGVWRCLKLGSGMKEAGRRI